MTIPALLRTATCLGVLALPSFAHGGQYRGPGLTVPPGAGSPGSAGPTAVGGGPMTRGPGAAAGPDLTSWTFWWEHNQAPYLALKAHVRSPGSATGADGWYLGGTKPEPPSLRPSEEQVRGAIVPALFAALEHETNNDLVTGCLVALAKIGDDGSAADAQRFDGAFLRFLTDANQEIRETAAIALGILAHGRSVPTLANLLWDTEAGRKLVGAREVDYRTRSFAAYGLGLVGARAASETDRMLIVSILRRALESNDTKTRDLEVACLVALGLVPLATIEPAAPSSDERRAAPPESSRLAQLDYVLAILRDEEREDMARAHCPITLARLLVGVPEPSHDAYRGRIATELIERLERGKDPAELVQSCVLALGALGTNDGKNPLDLKIRRELTLVSKQVAEPQARAFALISMAQVGARSRDAVPDAGLEDAKDFLLDQLAHGKNALQPWAGLASGVLCRGLVDAGVATPALEALRHALRTTLEDEKTPERVGAYALAAGLARDTSCAPVLARLVGHELQDDARGYVALGLALMDQRDAIGILRAIVQESKYRPELLRKSAIALGILGDKDVGPLLAGMLKEAHSLAAQAAITSALGFIGDRASVEPLLALLGDRLSSERARAFAAVALGNVADKEPLPWNSKIALDLNYRAATATLTEPLTSTGILDIL